MPFANLIGKATDASRAMDEGCPCRAVQVCDVIACWCYSLKIDRGKMAFGWPGEQEKRPPCAWPGHAAAARLREILGEIVEAHNVPACGCASVGNSVFYKDARCEQERAAARSRLT